MVKSWRADGFARAGEGIYAPCPGGGYDQIYVRTAGSWTTPVALGSQEVRSCSLLRWFEIPLPVADRTCYSDFGELIKYRTYELPEDFSTAEYAAGVLAASFEDETGVGDAWASDKALAKLRALQDDGAETFTVVRCFGPDDPEYGALLGKMPRGCRLDVGFADHTDIAVMRLQPFLFGRWMTNSVKLRRPSGQSSPSTAAGPRLSSCWPTMTRWISEAPSQIRSTRSSRNIRSATFSRM